MNEAMRQMRCDVAVIGAGPAGLSAAMELKRLGVDDVLVLEREPEAGGIPRHCGHPPFGLVEYRLPMTGPAYARRLVADARRAGVRIMPATTVTEILPRARLRLSRPEGPAEVAAARVLVTTGVRESPRAARLVSGTRPLGVMNTGALQAMVYLKGLVPFRRPVVVGTELVSFSALWTCRRAGIRPVAMLERNARPTVRRPLHLAARLFGVPLHLATGISAILGRDRVEAVRLTDGRTLTCDGVLFTGRFVPEATLARLGHLKLDAGTGGPQVDQFGRCSDPLFFAAGNVLRPVEHAGWCWNEGRIVARGIAASLAGEVTSDGADDITLHVEPPLRYAMPQRLRRGATGGMKFVQLRVERSVSGMLRVRDGERVLHARRLRAIPEQRIVIPVEPLLRAHGRELHISV